MRWRLAYVLFGAFLAGAVWSSAQAVAQKPSETPAETPGKFEQGRLGVELRDLTEHSVRALGLTQAHAVLVVVPLSGGPAERAGLRPGDVILELEGAVVGALTEFIAAVQRLGAGRTVTLGFLRGKERLTLQATLGKTTDSSQDAPDPSEQSDRKIAALEAILLIFNRETFPQEWAHIQHDLAATYFARRKDDRADNLEKAITAFEAALTVFTREAFPREWAVTQRSLDAAHRAKDHPKAVEYLGLLQHLGPENFEATIAKAERALTLEREIRHWPPTLTPPVREKMQALLLRVLGVAYYEWPRGDRAENVERAIAAYQQALQTLTRETSAPEWAALQHNLADAYQNRVRGERADNLEKAIAHLEAALTVRTREALPRDWAMTQNSLGLVYGSRISGDRADNLEKAIAALEAGLAVLMREAVSTEWAIVQTNLAMAYRSRVRGDRADNLEKAIAHLEAVLTVRTREALPRDWANTQQNLALAYAERVRGDRADNLEKAIATHEAALTVLTRETLPREWATNMINLGNAYQNRVRGDRADNLEQAIAAHEAALTVLTREALPREWAETQNNLGLDYENRIRGERADNLEKAIAAYTAALTVFRREALPLVWAQIQHNLANVYQSRIRGDRADNLEKAIAGYEAALTVLTRETLPLMWAQTTHALASAYLGRVRGERADNLEKAVAGYEAALTVVTREALPRDWANTQNSLANVYLDRIRGERGDNLERAIASYEAALAVFMREAQPREWAMTQNNLSIAYAKRTRGERADNLEKAIAAGEAALSVRTREAVPRAWAETQTNLATAYTDRIRGDRADNLEKAMAIYEAVLTVNTREAQPREWADTQYNLARAYQMRVRGERADNLQKAIAAAEAALTVKTREALPRQHLLVARLLGEVHLEAKEWRKAGLAYASARDAFLLLFGQGLNDAEARSLIAEAGPMFAEAAFAAAQRGESQTALALASESRARLMAAALKLQTLNLPADKRRRLDELRAAIRVEQRAVETAQGTERAAAVEKLASLRQELLGLVKGTTAAESRPQSVLAQARAVVAGGGGAIVVPVVTKVGAKILIVTSGAKPHDGSAQSAIANDLSLFAPSPPSPPALPSLTVLHLPDLTTDKLIHVLVRGDGKTHGWVGALHIHYLQHAELNRRWPEWLAAVSDLGPELWRLFGARLDAALRARGVKRGARLIWMPPGGLGILPLGLAQDPVSKRRLADGYEIVYAPSLEVLARAQQQVAKTTPANLAAIINPTGDLSGTEKEGNLVASHFPAKTRTVLVRTAATPDAVLAALKGKTHWHFASHGTFSWEDARQSALVMHGHDRLSVGRLLETDGLGRPRLVVLSACETGLYSVTSNPDEFIGLPGAFTALGAAGVLGTLWPVSDAATALLMAKFYELHMGQRLPPPTALRRAQLWLREATNADLQAYAGIAARQGRLESRHVAEIEQELSEEGLTRSRNSAFIEWIAPDAARVAGNKAPDGANRLPRPYAHPYFWAGFIYTGL